MGATSAHQIAHRFPISSFRSYEVFVRHRTVELVGASASACNARADHLKLATGS